MQLKFSEALQLLLELEDELRERKRFRKADAIDLFFVRYREKLKELEQNKLKIKELEEEILQLKGRLAAVGGPPLFTSQNLEKTAELLTEVESIIGPELPGGV